MKRQAVRWWESNVIMDNPTEERRKELPRGKADWAGFEAVYVKLSEAAQDMSMYCHLSDIHIETMAIMGTGHEETMKHHQFVLRSRGLIK